MSGYGFAMPGAKTRMTETGAVKLPVFRQTPQVRVSAFSTSDIISPIPLRPPDWRSEKTVTTARTECRKSTEVRPQEACPPDVRPAASLPGGLYFCRICVTRAARQPFLLHGQVAGKTRAARPRGGRGEPAGRRGGGRGCGLFRPAWRLQCAGPGG